jgi:hypothetical protein
VRTRHVVLLAAAVLIGTFAEAAARPRLYFEIRGVKEPKGTKPSVVDRARTVLLEELKKHPQVVTDLGDPPPTDLAKALKSKRLAGYGLVLRVTKVAHSMNPPAKGKVYRVLMVEVNVAIDAEKIPTGQMALAGEGSAQVGTEVSRFKEKERVELVKEALVEAIRQAVGKSIAKLSPGAKKRPARRKRRR